MYDNKVADPYINIPKGLNDNDLWKAISNRIDAIDTMRRSLKTQIHQASSNNKQQQLFELKNQSNLLLEERTALHNEMKQVKSRIKKSHREFSGRVPETLAIEFMLIAQQTLPKAVFENIRNEAAMNIVSYKS